MEEQNLRQKELYREMHMSSAQQMATQSDAGVKCPHCGTVNESGAMFCENCGRAIGDSLCPYCKKPLPPHADFCESCNHYVKKDICSFCGCVMSPEDAFCPDCGSSRAGIVCPSCHTTNIFGFCSNCGMALTESARIEQQLVRQTPLYQEMQAMAEELESLQKRMSLDTEEDLQRKQRADDIRERVLTLLNDGMPVTSLPKEEGANMNNADLLALLEKKRKSLQSLLDGMMLPVQTSPALSRRFVMARKPPLSRLGWRCNFKNELHRGPHECACPQMGGKWIVLEGKTETYLKK